MPSQQSRGVLAVKDLHVVEQVNCPLSEVRTSS